MKNITLFFKTCRLEGVRKAFVRTIAILLGVKVVRFYEKACVEDEPLGKYDIPLKCIQRPDLTNSSIKRAMFYEPKATRTLMNTYLADVLINYVRYMTETGAETYQERKSILEMVLELPNNENYVIHLAYAAASQWEWEGPSKDLLEKCKFILNSPNPCSEQNHIYMVYVCSLIELDDKREAEKILLQYIKNFGESDIHLYYPAAALATELNIHNEEIDKAAYIFNELYKNRNLLKQYLTNKSIAVVGSAPNEKGKKKGNEIDAHDVVIRFNNFEIEGYEADYGSRTTVWVRNTDAEHGGCKARYEEVQKYDLIVLETDIRRFRIPEMFLDTFYRYASEQKGKLYMLKYRDLMIKEMGSFPTSGGLLLYNLLKDTGDGDTRSDIYGFSFFEDNYDTKVLEHYDRKGYMTSNLHHNMQVENEFLRKLWGTKRNGH